MAGYLTTLQADARLSERFGISAATYEADLEAASDEVDQLAPFFGVKAINDQEREFPRQFSTVPLAVLDYVALRAAELAAPEDEEEPPITRESILDRSVTYATPKLSGRQRRLESALAGVRAHMKRTGSRV